VQLVQQIEDKRNSSKSERKKTLLGVCFKFKNEIHRNTWQGNVILLFVVRLRKFLIHLKIYVNEATSHNFLYSHEFILIRDGRNVHSHKILCNYFKW